MIYEHARVSHSEGEASSLLGCVENLAYQVPLDIVDQDEEQATRPVHEGGGRAA